ncbi:MAG TPA: hypothetical protein DGR79_08380 [Clostridiales bacterium]|nr:hypothetical protein [Clostridiales bacterium]HCW52055.1 hypothetical protein [Clostridiales bacterium]
MNFKGVRYPVVAVTLVVTLVFLFGARWVYQRQALDRPLEAAVLAVPGVEEVTVGQRQDVLLVRVRAGEVPHLEEFVADLWRAVEAVQEGAAVELEISDSRSERLQNIFYELHFHVQEAVATGRFSELPARLEEVSAGTGLTRGRVFVGPEYVYVQLHQGQACLYEIIPRRASGPSHPAGLDGSPPRLVTVGPWPG